MIKSLLCWLQFKLGSTFLSPFMTYERLLKFYLIICFSWLWLVHLLLSWLKFKLILFSRFIPFELRIWLRASPQRKRTILKKIVYHKHIIMGCIYDKGAFKSFGFLCWDKVYALERTLMLSRRTYVCFIMWQSSNSRQWQFAKRNRKPRVPENYFILGYSEYVF